MKRTILPIFIFLAIQICPDKKEQVKPVNILTISTTIEGIMTTIQLKQVAGNLL